MVLRLRWIHNAQACMGRSCRPLIELLQALLLDMKATQGGGGGGGGERGEEATAAATVGRKLWKWILLRIYRIFSNKVPNVSRQLDNNNLIYFQFLLCLNGANKTNWVQASFPNFALANFDTATFGSCKRFRTILWIWYSYLLIFIVSAYRLSANSVNYPQCLSVCLFMCLLVPLPAFLGIYLRYYLKFGKKPISTWKEKNQVIISSIAKTLL